MATYDPYFRSTIIGRFLSRFFQVGIKIFLANPRNYLAEFAYLGPFTERPQKNIKGVTERTFPVKNSDKENKPRGNRHNNRKDVPSSRLEFLCIKFLNKGQKEPHSFLNGEFLVWYFVHP